MAKFPQPDELNAELRSLAAGKLPTQLSPTAQAMLAEAGVTATADHTSGAAPLTVHFTASVSVAWTGDDGLTATGLTASHTYAAPGTYHTTATSKAGAAHLTIVVS